MGTTVSRVHSLLHVHMWNTYYHLRSLETSEKHSEVSLSRSEYREILQTLAQPFYHN